MTVGMDFDAQHDLLFVAGGPGKAYVYNHPYRALVASYDFGDATTSFLNDVVLTPYGAWFTDSVQPKLYFVPETSGIPGPARTLNLSGPAAGKPGTFHHQRHRGHPVREHLVRGAEGMGKLCTINPFTGTSSVVENVDIPDTDGLLFDHGQLWATQRFINQISRFRLSDDLRRGTLEKVITDPLLRVPVTSVKFRRTGSPW